MKRKRLKPGGIIVDGERYRATILHVVGRDSDGSYRTFRLVRDDEEVDLSSGSEAFIIVYAKPQIHERRQ